MPVLSVIRRGLTHIYTDVRGSWIEYDALIYMLAVQRSEISTLYLSGKQEVWAVTKEHLKLKNFNI
jgi:hypothetical protein